MKRPLFFLILSLCWLGIGQPVSAAPAAVIVETIEGEGVVQVEHQGRRLIAQEGDELVEKDKLATGAQSAVRLLFPNGTHLQIAENSSLELLHPEAGAAAAQLQKGSLLATVPKSVTPDGPHKLFIKTTSAVMGVRGTVFVVDHDPATGRTDLETREGRVEMALSADEVENGRGVPVSANQKLSADKKGLGKVESVQAAARAQARIRRLPVAARLEKRPLRSLAELRSLQERSKDRGGERDPRGAGREQNATQDRGDRGSRPERPDPPRRP